MQHGLTDEQIQRRELRFPQWAQMIEERENAGCAIVQLWPEGAPGYDASYKQEQPRLVIYPAHTQTRGMVIVLAGGAFLYKTANEAKPTADRFYEAGFQASILDYRVAPYDRLASFADVKRAIRYVRANARKLNTPPDKIGVLGYSAGGILVGMAGTLFDYGDPAAADALERISCRPDAVVQCYGSMATAPAYPHRPYILEEQNERARYSSDKNIRFDSPPFFLFQTAKDDPRNVLIMGRELADKGIPFEVHLFKEGAHGHALYNGKDGVENVPHTAHWSMLAIEWLEGCGF